MKVQFFNVYVQDGGTIEAGNMFDTVEAAIRKGRSIECQSFITTMVVIDGSRIKTMAIARG